MARDEQAKNWTADQWAFIHWLACPSAEREPITQRELAMQLAVHKDTVTRWKRLPGFMEAVAAAMRTRPSSEVRGLYNALRKEVEKGNVTAIKLALELMGEYPPKQETDAPVTVLITKMSMDEL